MLTLFSFCFFIAASILALTCLLFSIRLYCFALTYKGSSSRLSGAYVLYISFTVGIYILIENKK